MSSSRRDQHRILWSCLQNVKNDREPDGLEGSISQPPSLSIFRIQSGSMTIRDELAHHVFAAVAREEVWIIPGSGRPPRLVTRRERQGRALTRDDSTGVHIEASDLPPDSQAVSPAQVASARKVLETDLATQFESLPFAASRLDARSPIRLTLRGSVSIVARDEIESTRASLFVTASIGERGQAASVVTSPRFMTEDIKTLLAAVAAPPLATVDFRLYPIVWRGGSGAVLMHEAIGHAAEHAASPIVWPHWLRVDDVPDVDGGLRMGGVDDTGERLQAADLTAGGRPSARRRASFSDLPIARMTNLVVQQRNAPWPETLPLPRIEVSLVGGGRYEPLTDRVTIDVLAANLMSDTTRQALQPFELSESRKAIAEHLAGATGEPRRYPGVICSSEGQELFVGSFSADVVTSAMAS